jgi:diacylglycerol kinase family enzyme
MRAVLFHNPNAGGDENSKSALIAALKLAGLSVSYCSVKDDDFEDVLKKSADLIVVAGGDGTVTKVIARLPDRSIPVAILPLGTANNIARSLGVMGAPIQLAEVLRPDRSRRLDIGSVEGPWGECHFVEAVGVGPLAESFQKKLTGKIKGADALRKGRQVLQKLLRKAEPLDLDIVVDGEALKGDLLAVEVVNVAYTGPALPLAPHADAGDGKFEIVSVLAGSRKDMIEWLEAPQQAPAPVELRQGRDVKMTGNLAFQRVDDQVHDPIDKKATIKLKLEHEAAKVLVPPDDIVEEDAMPENGASKSK